MAVIFAVVICVAVVDDPHIDGVRFDPRINRSRRWVRPELDWVTPGVQGIAHHLRSVGIFGDRGSIGTGVMIVQCGVGVGQA